MANKSFQTETGTANKPRTSSANWQVRKPFGVLKLVYQNCVQTQSVWTLWQRWTEVCIHLRPGHWIAIPQWFPSVRSFLSTIDPIQGKFQHCIQPEQTRLHSINSPTGSSPLGIKAFAESDTERRKDQCLRNRFYQLHQSGWRAWKSTYLRIQMDDTSTSEKQTLDDICDPSINRWTQPTMVKDALVSHTLSSPRFTRPVTSFARALMGKAAPRFLRTAKIQDTFIIQSFLHLVTTFPIVLRKVWWRSQ